MKIERLTILLLSALTALLSLTFLSGCGQAEAAPPPAAPGAKPLVWSLPPGVKVGMKIWRAEGLRRPAEILEIHNQWAKIESHDDDVALWMNLENGVIIQVISD